MRKKTNLFKLISLSGRGILSRFICSLLFILLYVGTQELKAQADLPKPPANLQTVTKGSLVIPMDNVNQAVVAPFNLKAYGLVNALLQNDIPVKWIIKSGKVKDTIDFSASSERIYPTFKVAATIDYRASEFIIDSTYVNKSFYGFGKTATQVITAFGNSVAVYRLTTNVTVDVRYVLNQHPKIAVFNNGGNQLLHSKVLDAAGIPDYEDISAGVFNGLAACYTFCSEAHWQSTDANDSNITSRVRAFVLSGGNFLAQCYGIDTYEKYDLLHSTKGTVIKNATVTNSYFNPDMAFNQFMGTVVSNASGAERNWVRKAGSLWYSGFYYCISQNPNKDTVVAAATHLTAANAAGGNVYYLGSHDYFSNGGSDWTNITHVNAARMYLNAALVPSGRPSAFVASAGTNKTICTGQSVTLGGSPSGPAGATFGWQPAASLNDSTSANPIATPTVTTTYGLHVNNGGCPQASSVVVTVNPIPLANAGPNVIVCPGNPAVKLNGAVTNAAGGVWSGGAGSFSPNNTTLNATYTPSATEISNGSVTLTLSTTGMGTCATATSQVKINITSPLTVSLNPLTKVCFAQKGSLTATPVGGTSPYTYAWSTGETTQTISNKLPGSYTVTITDATSNACTKTTSLTFTENPSLGISTSSNTVATCTSTTSISATGIGGSGTLSYSWNTGGTTTSISVNAGTYTVTVKDGAGCTVTDAITVKSAQNGALAASTNTPATACFGGGTSIINAIGTGGFGAYTYSWNTGQTTSSITVPKGNYCATIKDSAGCISNACVSVIEESQLTVSAIPPLICIGSSATISAQPSGGSAPYSYSWSSGGNTSSVSQPAGTYVVTVTDANTHACTATTSVTVLQSPAITLTASSVTTSCKGASDGNASVAASGGTAPFSYSWSPAGGLGITTTAIGAGTYTVTVSDKIGCTSTQSVVVNQPTAVTATTSVSNPVSCNGGSNGVATISAAGGNSGFSYLWSNGATASTTTGLIATTYIVTVTDSKGCTAFSSVAITQPAVLSAATAISTNVLCFGGNTGVSIATASGGNAGYAYSWLPAGGTGLTGTGLSAGIYSVTITDSKGCTALSTVTITQPSVLTGAALTSANVKCAGGSNGTASISASGGISAYKFSWSPSGGTGTTATALAAGTYTVLVTDKNGCTTTTNTTVTEPPQLTVTASPTSYISCDATVVIAANANGGTGAYNYSWNNGNTTSSLVIVNSGHYAVVVKDANNCTAKDTVSVIALNSTLEAAVTAPPVICSGASVNISVSTFPGVSPYTYSWNTGETTTTISAKGGTHCATITDKDGCKATACVNISEDSIASVSVPVDTICFGSTGVLLATANGGSGPYSYSWNSGESVSSITKPAGTYIVTITDAIACSQTTSVTLPQANDLAIAFTSNFNVTCYGGNNGIAQAIVSGGKPAYRYKWSNNDTLVSYDGLTAGTYTVTINDNRGCSKTGTTLITEPLAPLKLDSIFTNVSCFGMNNGSATITASGGTTPYSYSWLTSGASGATDLNLKAGTYYAFVTDKNNCFASNLITITEPTVLGATVTKVKDVSCNAGTDGVATTVVSGGTAAYNYSWSGTSGITSATNNLLSAGTYSVTISDAGGCTTNSTVTITEPSALFAVPGQSNVICNGGNTGTASITAGGGAGSYSYSWMPGGASSATANNLSAASYTVIITDANSCTLTNTIVVTQPPALVAGVSSVSSTCGNANGSAMITASGGLGQYTYSWSPGSSVGATLNSVLAGAYNITVTDANGCTSTNTVLVNDISGAVVSSVSISNVSCNGGSNGSATIVASSGTGTYTYNWQPTGGTTSSANGLPAGTYTVNIKDANGCITVTTLALTEPNPVILSATPTNISCNGKNDGSLQALVSGGVPTYTYLWMPGGKTGQTASNLSPNLYTLTVTDANSCTLSSTYNITEPSALVFAASVANIKCNAACDGGAVVTGVGGTGAYSYLWSTGATVATVSSLCPGNYCVVVSDANGCTLTTCATITQPSALTVNATSVSAHCNHSDGSASAVASGGTAGYSYSWNVAGASGMTVNSMKPGTYCVSVSDANQCVFSTCTVVQNIPGVSASPIFSTNATCFGYCNGSATVGASGGVFPYTYSWSTSQTASTISGLCNGNYSVKITDGKQCMDSALIIITQPAVVNVISNAVSTLCIGQSTVLSLQTSGGSGGYTYTWSPTGPTVSPKVTTNYTVIANDVNGCTSAAQIISVPVNPPINVLVGDTGLCPGIKGIVKAGASGGDGNYTYTWLPGNDSTNSINASPGMSYTVIINDGCGTPKDTGNISVATFSLPVIDVMPDMIVGCVPVCVNFGNQSTIANGTITGWNWDFGDSASSNSYKPSHCFTYADTFAVSITATSDKGCISKKTYNNMVIVNGRPTAAFSLSPSVTTLPDATIHFTNQSKGANAYLWNFGDERQKEDTSTSSSPMYTYSDTGRFCTQLIVINKFGCTDSVTHCTTVKPEFTFYIPNAFTPNKDGLNDEFGGVGMFIKDYKMLIFDRWGQLIFESNDLAKKWSGKANYGDQLAQQDIYVYKIVLNDIYNNEHKYLGHVTLLK